MHTLNRAPLDTVLYLGVQHVENLALAFKFQFSEKSRNKYIAENMVT